MLEYRGKYGSCKVMVDEVEATAISQIYDFLNCPASEGATIRIMPDVHAGAGVTIGMTATITSKVIPNMIGVDIGCGVATYKFPVGGFSHEKNRFQRLDTHIRKSVPSGFEVHSSSMVSKRDQKLIDDVEAVSRLTRQDTPRVMKSLGTLGGGNHFIELGKAEGDHEHLHLTIHSGSRNFGLQVAGYHQKLAKGRMGNYHGMEWLEGSDLQLYIEHMKIAQMYAMLNRKMMASAILKFFELTIEDTEKIESVHNYIDFEDGVIRKGAISASLGKKVVIPWNMKDGLIVGVGKGNPDWNCSAPHGAGRVMGRGEAKRKLDVSDFEKVMEDAGVWSSCVSEGTLDESPMVYKNPKTIQDALGDTVDVLYTVKPIYNFKAK